MEYHPVRKAQNAPDRISSAERLLGPEQVNDEFYQDRRGIDDADVMKHLKMQIQPREERLPLAFFGFFG